MSRPTPEDVQREIESYVYGVEREVEDARRSLVEKVEAIRSAELREFEDYLSDALHAIESDLDSVIGALPCSQGVADYISKGFGGAFDIAEEVGLILHELQGRKMTETPEAALAWVTAALVVLSRAESNEEAGAEIGDLLNLAQAVAV